MGDVPPTAPASTVTVMPSPSKPIEKGPDKVLKKSKRWLRAQIAKQGMKHRTRRAKTAVVGVYGSHSYYNNLWAESMKDIRDLMGEEKKRANASANADRKKMFELLFTVYRKYLNVYKNMDEVYDQMVHPQKRILVRKLLDLLIGRILELQNNLVRCDLSENYYFDDLADFEGLMPRDMDMPIPKYYYYDPTPEMLQRDQWFSNVADRKHNARKEEEEKQRKQKQAQQKEAEEKGFGPGMDEESHGIGWEDVLPLQSMERTRQAKGRYYVGRYYQEEEMAYTKKKDKTAPRMDPGKAAILIQKLVRGFLARQRIKSRRLQELEFLGLRPTNQNFSTDFSYDMYYRFSNDKCSQNAQNLEKLKESRRKLRRLKQKQYEDAQVLIQKQMLLIEGPDMAERFKHQIRSWFLNEKEEKGKFPDIPKAEYGGSRLMICPESLPEDVLEKGKMATDPDYAAKKKKEKDKAKEQAKKDKAKKKKDKGKKGKNKGPAIPAPILEQPEYYDDFKEANVEYNKFWRGGDDKENPDQNYEKKYIIREKRLEVSIEVREQVDIAMKAELDYLKKVIEKKKGKKGKGKGKKGKGKGKKGKGKGKGKGKKGKKGKKKKDMTADRTMESLFEELVKYNIIHQYPQVRMKDLVGQCSLINADLRAYHTEHPMTTKVQEWFMPGDINPPPSFGDTLRAIKDICILPMGSVEVHQLPKDITKSVLIVGPPGSGKHTLVNMICTELKATLFDLTAKNIGGRYPDKNGLKMLWHLVEKVGHAMPPVIILIDNCEKMFQKKTPEDDKSEPKRLKKSLAKFLKKSVGPNDLFMLIGISNEPWLGSFKPMSKTYQKIIYIPPPDYGTRFAVWKRCLSTNPDVLGTDINYPLLTKLSHGWTTGHIFKTCEDVIQNHHKNQEKQKRDRRKDMDPWAHLGNLVTRTTTIGKMSVDMNKLLDCITQYDPVFLEQDKCWTKWWNKTPLMKARLATQIKGGGDKKKKGKKGKKK